ncbi:type II secretion system protein [Sporosarcina aquimarina]|uniref:type II secretion system protein n=1 Tax=Sporosarcina aquimarina TaxID=114975 RepID=UPI001C8D422E|nr:prepilin-type N-terminal cleavage/methylation domain-containing protein [Sporosarcina aquimarina]MBY0222518.1 prepilin-type N-terminal cleavage/methylation domain-containing protein [Sporosarcina aquimarina]
MKMFLQKKLKNEKGLTLVELLAVIVILGIIAAIAVPAIGNIIDNSRAKALVSDGINVMNAGNMYFTENSGESTVDIAKLKSEKYLESEGKLSTATVNNVTGGENTISAKGTNGKVTLDISDKTLKQLSTQKVSIGDSGAITLGEE